jgi:hypothetical protein
MFAERNARSLTPHTKYSDERCIGIVPTSTRSHQKPQIVQRYPARIIDDRNYLPVSIEANPYV